MLRGLFGNQNVERILFFLFVNESCYANQIQSALKVPLTPIQKAFHRLEKDKIVTSHLEGKFRIYSLNPDYVFRLELELLLKKAYTLLSPQEKKHYCFIHKPKLKFLEEIEREKKRRKALSVCWDRLQKVRSLSISAKSRTSQLVNLGKADVEVESLSETVLVFCEKGHWLQGQQSDTLFRNSFRWTLDLQSSLISLEHLRYGDKRPVFLFHLTPVQHCRLESVDAHLCGEDNYLGNIELKTDCIDFHWRIIGPQKNECLLYRYH